MRFSIIFLFVSLSWAGSSHCPALDSLAGTGTDVIPTIQACANAQGDGAIIDADASFGVYSVGSQWRPTVSFTLTTTGKSVLDTPCTKSDATCATFRALPSLNVDYTTGGGAFLFDTSGKSVSVDHIIFDGNKDNRPVGTPGGNSCLSAGGAQGRAGFNIVVGGFGGPIVSLSFTNSVSKNAPCGTALEVTVIGGGNSTITNNIFADNGYHAFPPSDGLSCWRPGASSNISYNTFQNNTDVDVIFGRCPNCTIRYNSVTHTGPFITDSFMAFSVYGISAGEGGGDFTGADIAYNTVDCGPTLGCGNGLGFAGTQWSDSSPIWGGSVHDNFIRRAQIGVAMPGVSVSTPTSMRIYNNEVEDNGSSTISSTATLATGAYQLTGTNAFDFSLDTVPVSWYRTSPTLTGLPNSTNSSQTAYVSNFGTDPTVVVGTTYAAFTWTSASVRTSQCEWGSTTAYGNKTTLNYTGVTSHSVLITGLTPNTTYHARCKQKTTPTTDYRALTDYSSDLTFTTTNIPPTTITGNATIQGNVVIR